MLKDGIKGSDDVANEPDLLKLRAILPLYSVGTGIAVSKLVETYAWSTSISHDNKVIICREALQESGFTPIRGLSKDALETVYIKE